MIRPTPTNYTRTRTLVALFIVCLMECWCTCHISHRVVPILFVSANGGAAVVNEQQQSQLLRSTGVNVNEFIDTYIQQYDVMVFAKSYCPHCQTSKSIIDLLRHETTTTTTTTTWTEHFLYLDQDMIHQEDASMIQNALLERTGQRTVPNIFIGGQHIGGNTDLVTLYQSGELRRKLKEIALSKTVHTEL